VLRQNQDCVVHSRRPFVAIAEPSQSWKCEMAKPLCINCPFRNEAGRQPCMTCTVPMSLALICFGPLFFAFRLCPVSILLCPGYDDVCLCHSPELALPFSHSGTPPPSLISSERVACSGPDGHERGCLKAAVSSQPPQLCG